MIWRQRKEEEKEKRVGEEGGRRGKETWSMEQQIRSTQRAQTSAIYYTFKFTSLRAVLN